MMVSQEESAASRATTLTLVGGELALDFANTSSGRGFDTHRDHLRTPEDLIGWAEHAKVIPPDEAGKLAAATREDSALAARLLDSALALREDIYALGVEVAAGRAAPAGAMENLTRTHALALSRARLSRFDRHYAWSWSVEGSPVEAVLGPISLSALTILLQADLTRIKQCRGEKCGWLFLDTTKNKSRRWCEMEICGNRAKQKRFGAKARGS